MRCDVSQLAVRTEISVDTIRYYQSRGLLHPPCREGRRAFYDESHVSRLERIRALANRGFSLAAIAAVLDRRESDTSDGVLLGAIEQEAQIGRYSAAEIAHKLGIAPTVVEAVENAGLAEPAPGAKGTRKYTGGDLEVAAGAVKLIRRGFPLLRLIRLAVKHDRAVRKTVDDAIDMFDEHVRKKGDRAEAPEAVAEAFQELMPAVSRMIAHHFERVLINRALKRLKSSGERRALRAALVATSSGAVREKKAS